MHLKEFISSHLHTLFETEVCRRVEKVLDYCNLTFQKHDEMKVSLDTLNRHRENWSKHFQYLSIFLWKNISLYQKTL